jgi:hypothetical protein
LEKPGCFQVEAYVLGGGSSIAIYSGQAIVAVK